MSVLTEQWKWRLSIDERFSKWQAEQQERGSEPRYLIPEDSVYDPRSDVGYSRDQQDLGWGTSRKRPTRYS